MNLDLRPYIVVWIVLALVVAALFIRRKMIAAKEDDNIHVMSGPNPEQTIIAAKLDVIDKWGKLMTVVTVLLGIVIAGLYIYSTFVGKPSIGE